MVDQSLTSGARLLRLGVAAERLGVGKEVLRRWADAGQVPHVRFPNGERRFRPEVIDALLEEQGELPARPSAEAS